MADALLECHAPHKYRNTVYRKKSYNWDSLAANIAPREYPGENTPWAFTVLIPVY